MKLFYLTSETLKSDSNLFWWSPPGAFVLKHTKSDGSVVSVESREDIHKCLEAVKSVSKTGNPATPILRVQLCPVSSGVQIIFVLVKINLFFVQSLSQRNLSMNCSVPKGRGSLEIFCRWSYSAVRQGRSGSTTALWIRRVVDPICERLHRDNRIWPCQVGNKAFLKSPDISSTCLLLGPSGIQSMLAWDKIRCSEQLRLLCQMKGQ